LAPPFFLVGWETWERLLGVGVIFEEFDVGVKVGLGVLELATFVFLPGELRGQLQHFRRAHATGGKQSRLGVDLDAPRQKGGTENVLVATRERGAAIGTFEVVVVIIVFHIY